MQSVSQSDQEWIAIEATVVQFAEPVQCQCVKRQVQSLKEQYQT
jgi:hypothetical protein